jgi:hypothetical protein
MLGIAGARLKYELAFAAPRELPPARVKAAVQDFALPHRVTRSSRRHAVDGRAVAGDEEGRVAAEMDTEHLSFVDVDPDRIRSIRVDAHDVSVVADAAIDRPVIQELEARNVPSKTAVDLFGTPVGAHAPDASLRRSGPRCAGAGSRAFGARGRADRRRLRKLVRRHDEVVAAHGERCDLVAGKVVHDLDVIRSSDARDDRFPVRPRVERSIAGERQAHDVRGRGVPPHGGVPLTIDGEHAPFGTGRRKEQMPPRIPHESPHVQGVIVGARELGRGSIGCDRIDAPFGQRAGEEPSAVADRQRCDQELLRLCERLDSIAVHTKDAAVVAGSQIDGAVVGAHR